MLFQMNSESFPSFALLSACCTFARIAFGYALIYTCVVAYITTPDWLIDCLIAGRVVFDNLRKTVCYTVTHTLPGLLPFLLYLVLNIPLAIGTIPLLFLDIVTDIIPAINLAYERPESDIMNRKPRDQQKDRLVDTR